MPRLNIDITDEQAEMLREKVPYGFRRRLYQKITDQVLVMLERGGMSALYGYLDGKRGLDEDKPPTSENIREAITASSLTAKERAEIDELE